jgi:hypothetical protein
MPGPAPKDPALRQRRNRPKSGAVLAAEAQTRQRAPRLPKREGREWHTMTRAWWRDIWHSPMAAEYLNADMHALYRLAVLIDQYWQEPDSKLAAEIRLQQQAFGLTPLDRRRLEWTIEQAEAASTRKAQRQVRRAHAGEMDPREALKAVK